MIDIGLVSRWFLAAILQQAKISRTTSSWNLIRKPQTCMDLFIQGSSRQKQDSLSSTTSSWILFTGIAQELCATNKRCCQSVYLTSWEHPELKYSVQNAKRYTSLSSNRSMLMEHTSEHPLLMYSKRLSSRQSSYHPRFRNMSQRSLALTSLGRKDQNMLQRLAEFVRLMTTKRIRGTKLLQLKIRTSRTKRRTSRRRREIN